jgi:uncharacterized surface protein with fasciclin (FAS1) repeats
MTSDAAQLIRYGRSRASPNNYFSCLLQAFAVLLEALNVTAAQLLANKELLTAVLAFHILPEPHPASDVTAAGINATSLLGQDLNIKLVGT